MNALPLILFFLAVATIGYRYYSAFLAAKVAALDDSRVTPAHRFTDGHNYVPTNKWVLFGHHFAAISGAGPLIGPVLAAQFGFMPGLLWITLGVVLRRRHARLHHPGRVRAPRRQVAGRHRAQRDLARGRGDGDGRHPLHRGHRAGRARHRGGQRARRIAVGRLHHRHDHPHRARRGPLHAPPARRGAIQRGSIVRGGGGAARASWPGAGSPGSFAGAVVHARPGPQITLAMAAYGFVASVLPVWMLLCPRDYLSSYMKLGTIFALVVSTILVGAAHPRARLLRVHPRRRADRSRQALPVRVHHHRLRRHLRLPFPGRLGHDAEDDRPRDATRG